jgi:hypothetical protein
MTEECRTAPHRRNRARGFAVLLAPIALGLALSTSVSACGDSADSAPSPALRNEHLCVNTATTACAQARAVWRANVSAKDRTSFLSSLLNVLDEFGIQSCSNTAPPTGSRPDSSLTCTFWSPASRPVIGRFVNYLDDSTLFQEISTNH